MSTYHPNDIRAIQLNKILTQKLTDLGLKAKALSEQNAFLAFGSDVIQSNNDIVGPYAVSVEFSAPYNETKAFARAITEERGGSVEEADRFKKPNVGLLTITLNNAVMGVATASANVNLVSGTLESNSIKIKLESHSGALWYASAKVAFNTIDPVTIIEAGEVFLFKP